MRFTFFEHLHSFSDLLYWLHSFFIKRVVVSSTCTAGLFRVVDKLSVCGAMGDPTSRVGLATSSRNVDRSAINGRGKRFVAV